ncbi:MAG: DUF4270 domain-containing protein [Bacteroides sp.]|nr:DUF4270 domain-containing protein [Bacteroides sp.]MCI1680972.1 DUF4270 domain-containing protein [Bacteroides sp.]
MKTKYISLLFVTILLSLWGCDDNTGSLGIGMLPDSDGIKTQTKTFDVTTQTIIADSVYARTSTGYIGRFSDPNFGYYEASFLTELNCTDNFTFPAVYDPEKKTGYITGDSITGARLVLFYSKWFGDSLNACRMSVYELNKKLDKDRYTNIDPEKYYNKYDSNSLLGTKAYSAHDEAISDNVRYGTDANGYALYSPHISFTLSKEFGDKLLKLNRQHPEYFKNSDEFINHVFKGIYAKCEKGDGTILYIDQVALQVQFNFYTLNDSTHIPYKKKETGKTDQDSTYYAWKTVFSSTKEVIQANQFLNSDLIKKKLEDKTCTYIKSPAGLFTEATLPYDAIVQQLTNDTLNAAKLTFTNYAQKSDYKYSMDVPNNVLLLRKKDFKSFFEESQLPDNVTSFAVTHNNVATNQYTFNNIARLVTTCINEKNAAKAAAGSTWNETKWENDTEWNKVILIPVTATYDTSGQRPILTGVQNDLKPGYAKLKGGEGETNKLKLEITYSTSK